MNLRLLLGVAVIAGTTWVAACGSSDSSDVTTPATDDGGAEASSATDGSSQTDGSFTPTACDSAQAKACGAAKCDAKLGCVSCLADTDCTGTDKFCILGRCEACRTNNDCGVAAPVCFPGDHRCHASCTGDAAVACAADTPLCDTATGACVGCQTGADCPAGRPLCEPTTKTCVECTANSECPAARPFCSLRDFSCVTCLTSADCGAGKICDPREQTCVAACTDNTQCGGSTPVCNTATSICVGCLTTPDCAGSAITPICDTNRTRCVQCVTSQDCGDAGAPICDNSKCVQCKNDKDCPGQNAKCDNGVCQ